MIMERTEVLNLMGQLKLFGMKNAYDEILATALKRQHEPQRFAGDLLKAEISEKQARSIKYQLTIAKLPLSKDVDGFEFNGTPINEGLVRDLAKRLTAEFARNLGLSLSGAAPEQPKQLNGLMLAFDLLKGLLKGLRKNRDA